jgi:hypothetical protein
LAAEDDHEMLVVPDDLHSPIERIAMSVPKSLELIAPERAADLAPYFPHLTLYLVADRSMIARINPQTGEITVSALFLEVEWALAYAYHVFHHKVLSTPHWRGQEVDLRADQEVASAMDLLTWAISATATGSTWPVGAPSPALEPPEKTMEYGAQQLCLGATGVILHHELAHKYLGHKKAQPPDDYWTLEAERDADAAAVNWVLDPTTCPPGEFAFRAMCVAIAFLRTAARSIHTGDYGGLTHPRTFDRLFHSLNEYLDRDEATIWGFVGAILLLHMRHMEIPPPTQKYETFYDFVDACIDRLAAEWKRARAQQ